MRSLGWTLIQCDWCVLMRRNLDTNKCTRRTPYGDKGRDWSDSSTRQVPTNIARKPLKEWKGMGQILPYSPQKEPTLPAP